MIHKKVGDDVAFTFGKGVGGQIYDAMNLASHSIHVITPYISQGYVDFLLRKQDEGINVSLVTTTEAQKGKMDQIYRKILLQHRSVDENKLAYKTKAMKWCVALGALTLLIGASVFGWYHLHHHFKSIYKELNAFMHEDSLLFFITLAAMFITYKCYNKFKRIKIFSYLYSTKFPFVVMPSIYSGNIPHIKPMIESFVHAKVYVVDDKDIYIGSANLTHAGLRHNIESFIKITAQDVVKEIVEEIKHYLDKHGKAVCINYLGALVYDEAAY